MKLNHIPLRLSLFFLLIFYSFNLQADYLPVTSYKIKVRLNDIEKVIYGQEQIIFLNTSVKDIDTLHLQLYANAFSSDSTFFVKGSKSLKELLRQEEYRGFIQIKKVRTLTKELDWDINETQMKIFLSQPLKSGSEIEISLEFELKLPKIISRMGYYEDNYLLSEWFPKMAVLEKNGVWKDFPYHHLTEFYSD
ncbi:MAG: hypothetical protein OEV55_05950, partial [candidate division Zixibacteria bacterium]|nr:hypothetical protein [candidate division Zixibacteria bacterium]